MRGPSGILGSALTALSVSLWAGTGAAAPRAGVSAPLAEPPGPRIDSPYHGSLDGLAYGGHGEVRFAEDRVAGVSDPEWFSFGRVSAFAMVRLNSRVDLVGDMAWDPGTDDFAVERAELSARFRGSMEAHAGIFLTPLGRTNLSHDAPRNEFDERSLVATQLVGVPNAQLGAGIRGLRQQGDRWVLSYEVDLVTGYDDGLIMDSPGGTRVPRGRNNYGDNNGLPALAGRVAVHPSPGAELGLAAQVGQYNQTQIGGVSVDGRRYVHVVVADATTRVAGFDVFGEGALALIDVPPGLEALFAQEQCGGSIEMVRTLREPLFGSWRLSRLTAAVRADAVDFDRSIAGDSRHRLSASLNFHRLPRAVTRFGWYYEIRRDRFNNDTPIAGVTFSAASYF